MENKPPTEDKKPPTAIAEPPPFTEVRFVKNLFPGERITFKDGTSYKFPAPLFICRDKELADKIIAVASQYSIVIQ